MKNRSVFTVVDAVWNNTIHTRRRTNKSIHRLKTVTRMLSEASVPDLMEMAGRENRTAEEAIYRAAVQLTRIIANNSNHDGLRFAAIETLGALSDKGLPCREGFKIGLGALSENEPVPIFKDVIGSLVKRIVQTDGRTSRVPRFTASSVAPR